MKEKEMGKEKGQISVVLPCEQLSQLRTLGKAVDCSIGDLVRRAVCEWFVSSDFKSVLKRAEEAVKVRDQISNLATLHSNVSKQ
jgi:hypothetical protein